MSESLHKLVKSMSKSEKRQFKLLTNAQSGGKKYVILFDALDRQDLYDEEKLKRAIASKLPLGHLHVTKNYLFSAILRMLRMAESERNVDARLRASMDEITILNYRNIFNKAEQILQKSKALALAHDKNAALLDLLRLEERLLPMVNMPEQEAAMSKINNEQRSAIGKLTDWQELHEVNNRALAWSFTNGIVRTEEQAAWWRTLRSERIAKMDPDTLSFSARVHYYVFHRLYYAVLGEHQCATGYGLKACECYESNQTMLQDRQHAYLSVLCHTLVSAVYSGQYDLGLKLIKKLEPLEMPWKGVRTETFVAHTKLELLVQAGEYGELEALEPLVIELRDQRQQRNRLLAGDCNFLLAHAHFARGNYKKAIQYLTLIFNDRDLDRSTGLFTNAWLLQLILHYEIGDKDYLPIAIKSTYNYLYRREHLYAAEKVILSYLKLLTKAKPGSEGQLLEEFDRELTACLASPLERTVFDDFPFDLWIKSKLEGTPFAEYVRAHRLQKRQDDLSHTPC